MIVYITRLLHHDYYIMLLLHMFTSRLAMDSFSDFISARIIGCVEMYYYFQRFPSESVNHTRRITVKNNQLQNAQRRT